MTNDELKELVITMHTEFIIVKQDVALLKSDRAKLFWAIAGFVATGLADYLIRAVSHA